MRKILFLYPTPDDDLEIASLVNDGGYHLDLLLKNETSPHLTSNKISIVKQVGDLKVYDAIYLNFSNYESSESLLDMLDAELDRKKFLYLCGLISLAVLRRLVEKKFRHLDWGYIPPFSFDATLDDYHNPFLLVIGSNSLSNSKQYEKIKRKVLTRGAPLYVVSPLEAYLFSFSENLILNLEKDLAASLKLYASREQIPFDTIFRALKSDPSLLFSHREAHFSLSIFPEINAFSSFSKIKEAFDENRMETLVSFYKWCVEQIKDNKIAFIASDVNEETFFLLEKFKSSYEIYLWAANKDEGIKIKKQFPSFRVFSDLKETMLSVKEIIVLDVNACSNLNQKERKALSLGRNFYAFEKRNLPSEFLSNSKTFL